MEHFLTQYPMHTQIEVAWGDMDALQHVNNVMYFKYFETARIDFFRQIGLLVNSKDMAIGPVLSETQAKYKSPITYPDSLIVGISISDLKQDRFMMHYHVFSQAQQKVTTQGYAQVVMFNFNTGKKATLSPALLDKLKTYEQVS